jgi:hypothetical protein
MDVTHTKWSRAIVYHAMIGDVGGILIVWTASLDNTRDWLTMSRILHLAF